MKKIILGLTLIGSLGSFASESFKDKLSNGENMLVISKNYKAKYVNDDNTTSIVQPRFNNPTNAKEKLFLSRRSDSNGICKLYGLKDSVAAFHGYLNHSSPLQVVLSDDSKFSHYNYASGIHSVTSIICNTGKDQEVSDNYERLVENEDGTITVVWPRFKVNGYDAFLSRRSSRVGVCKLFGLGEYVNSVTRYSGETRRLQTVISKEAKFDRFNLPTGTKSISSIICEKSL